MVHIFRKYDHSFDLIEQGPGDATKSWHLLKELQRKGTVYLLSDRYFLQCDPVAGGSPADKPSRNPVAWPQW